MVSDFLRPDAQSAITDTCLGGPCYDGGFTGPVNGTTAGRRSSPGPQIGAPGFEPGTSPTRTVRATRLRHAPRPLSIANRHEGILAG